MEIRRLESNYWKKEEKAKKFISLILDKNEVKTVTKVEEVVSFFTFFKNYDYDETKPKTKIEKEEDDDDEEEEEEDDQQIIDDEYDLGLFVKDDFIPYSLEYYLDINPEGDDDFEDEEGEDESEDEQPKAKKGGYSKLNK